MQDQAYAKFREKFLARKKGEEKERDDLLRLHSQAVRQLESRHANLMKAVGDGDYSAPIIAQLNKVDAELTQARAKRDAAAPEPIFLPQDLPALYRAHIDDLVGTISDEGVSGRASEELHQIIDTVVVTWDAEATHHALELRGKLLEMLNMTKPAFGAGLGTSESSLKLVAGADNRRNLPTLSAAV